MSCASRTSPDKGGRPEWPRRGLVRFLSLLLLVPLLLTAQSAVAMDGLQWTWIDPLPTGAGLYRVIYANQQFVAVGEAETILTSPDGLSWTAQRSGLDNDTFDLVDVAWGNGNYVALGRYKELEILGKDDYRTVEAFLPLTSPDGRNWTVHYDRKGFALGTNGTWRLDDLTTAQLAFDGLDFVLRIETLSGRLVFLLSDNGLDWTRDDGYDPKLFPRYHPTAPGPVAHGNGIHVSVTKGHVYEPTVFTSDDGQTWHKRLSHPAFYDIAFGSGLFVGVGVHRGDRGDRYGYVMTSPDGLNWTQQGSQLSQPKENIYRTAAVGNGVTVVGGQRKIVLLDAALRPTVIPFERDLFDIKFINGFFVAATMHEQYGACGYGAIYTSPDGQTWTMRWDEKEACLTRIVQTGDGVAVLSRRNSLIVSQDLVTWEARPMALPERTVALDIAWSDGHFTLITQRDSLIYTSDDGQTWTARDPKIRDEFRSISYAEGLFVISGDRNIYVSRDGLSWSFHTVSSTLATPVRQVYFQEGQYVGVGSSNLIFSTDGRRWRVVSAERLTELNDLASDGNHLILVGQNRILAAKIPGCRAYFFDVPEAHPICKPAELLYRHGVTTGYENRTFRPENQLTRAEIAKMVVVAMGQYPNPTGRVAFQDVAGHWSVTGGYLQGAIELGVISGYNPQQFGPDDPLTRAQLIKIAAVSLGLGEAGSSSYTGVPDWADGWVGAAQQAKLIGPQAPFPIWTDSDLDGDLPVTRGEAATLLANLLTLRK